MLTLRQAVDMLADDRGYMPGVAQSAVLQTFGGPRVASEALALAGIFARRAPPRHCDLLPPQAEHRHDDEDAYLEACAARAPRASRARGRRGRGRGRGRNAPRPSDAEMHRQEHVALPQATYAWKASCAAEFTHCKAHGGKSAAHCDKQCAPP